MCGADSIYTEGHAAYDADFVYRIAHTEAEGAVSTPCA